MFKGIVTFIAGTLSLFVIKAHVAYLQPVDSGSVMVMFYNVENLFDTFDDPATDDDEFLPEGVRRWNQKRYRSRINSLYKVIIAAGNWSPPEIIAFCEIENRKVLEDLVYNTNLSKYNYEIIHSDSPDPRGIDVCLIYRKEFVSILSWRYLIPDSLTDKPFVTRNVLQVKSLIANDTVNLFINHWPSRRGGVLAGEALRKEIAGMLREKADSLAISHKDRKIIITGDFNATPGDDVVKTVSFPYASGLRMINLSAKNEKEKGTYRYRGTWEAIDQFIVSDRLLESETGVYTSEKLMRIFKPGFLLRKDPVYPGMSPYSAWSGFRYQGGFSDHLPVILELKFR